MENAFTQTTSEERLNEDAGKDGTELRIILVGKTGVGKSATANTFIGQKYCIATTSLKSVTTMCMKKSFVWKGRNITIVDTPGFFDTCISAPDTIKEISRCVVMTSPGPHAIILVIQAGRFTKEEEDAVKIIQNVFGEESARYMVILFTHTDSLEDQTFDEFVQEGDGNIKCLIDKCGGRICAFNNKAIGEDRDEQVSKVIEIIDTMVQKNNGTFYTAEMYKRAEKILKKTEEDIKKYEKQKEKEQNKIKCLYEKDMERIKQEYSKGNEIQKRDITGLYLHKFQAIQHDYEQNVAGARSEAENHILHFIQKVSVGLRVGGALGLVAGSVGGPVGAVAGAAAGAAVGAAVEAIAIASYKAVKGFLKNFW